MEVLAQCSRVLYDVELLEVMKKLRSLENKDKTPQVKFENKDVWIHSKTNFKNAVKAWHLHQEATLNYVCIKGKVKLVLFVVTCSGPRTTKPSKCEVIQDSQFLNVM